MKSYYVYILLCSDNSYYTGITNNLERRFNEHQSGLNTESYTFSRRPLQLVHHTQLYDVSAAIAFEKKIKKLSKAKKQALINAHYEQLPMLAKKKFKK